MSSDKRIIAVLFSEQDLKSKVEELKQKGYEENDLHLMAQDPERLDSFEEETEEVGSFKDKFKGFFTGEGSVREGIKSLGLTDAETELYTEEVAKGGILIYADVEREGIIEALAGSEQDTLTEEPNDRQRHQFINSVDNNYDEQEDRFARGETFSEDPRLLKDEHHVSFSTQEDPQVEKARGGTSEAEKHTKSDEKYR